MPPKSKFKKGNGAKNSQRAVAYDSVTSEDEAPPRSRASSRAAKKRRAAVQNPDPVSDVSSTDEAPSVHAALQNLTALMTTMSTRIDGLEDGSRPRRRVAFTDDPPSANEELAPVAGGSRPASRGASTLERPLSPHEPTIFPTPTCLHTVRTRDCQRSTQRRAPCLR